MHSTHCRACFNAPTHSCHVLFNKLFITSRFGVMPDTRSLMPKSWTWAAHRLQRAKMWATLWLLEDPNHPLSYTSLPACTSQPPLAAPLCCQVCCVVSQIMVTRWSLHAWLTSCDMGMCEFLVVWLESPSSKWAKEVRCRWALNRCKHRVNLLFFSKTRAMFRLMHLCYLLLSVIHDSCTQEKNVSCVSEVLFKELPDSCKMPDCVCT